MARRWIPVVLALLVALLLVGCEPESSPEDDSDLAAFEGGPDYGYDDLLAELETSQEADIEVEGADAGDAPLSGGLFAEAEVRTLSVNGEPVYVYEFDNQEAATAAAATVSADAALVDAVPVEWGGTPHLYAAGQLVVVHIAPEAQADLDVTELLQSALGAEFAGGPIASETPTS